MDPLTRADHALRAARMNLAAFAAHLRQRGQHHEASILNNVLLDMDIAHGSLGDLYADRGVPAQ